MVRVDELKCLIDALLPAETVPGVVGGARLAVFTTICAQADGEEYVRSTTAAEVRDFA